MHGGSITTESGGQNRGSRFVVGSKAIKAAEAFRPELIFMDVLSAPWQRTFDNDEQKG